jgi:hypothetical protein
MAALLRGPEITLRLVSKTAEDIKSDEECDQKHTSDTSSLDTLADNVENHSLDDPVEFTIAQALLEAKSEYFRTMLKVGGFQEGCTSDLKEITMIPGVLSSGSVEALLFWFYQEEIRIKAPEPDLCEETLYDNNNSWSRRILPDRPDWNLRNQEGMEAYKKSQISLLVELARLVEYVSNLSLCSPFHGFIFSGREQV